MLKIIVITYIIILAGFIAAWNIAYRFLKGTRFGSIFNYSVEDPRQAWSRPRNIKDLWQMLRNGKLEDAEIKKWVRIYIYSRRVSFILGIPAILILIYLVTLPLRYAP